MISGKKKDNKILNHNFLVSVEFLEAGFMNWLPDSSIVTDLLLFHLISCLWSYPLDSAINACILLHRSSLWCFILWFPCIGVFGLFLIISSLVLGNKFISFMAFLCFCIQMKVYLRGRRNYNYYLSDPIHW
jgi:hypothetical protein